MPLRSLAPALPRSRAAALPLLPGVLLWTLSALVIVYIGWDLVANQRFLMMSAPSFILGEIYGQPSANQPFEASRCARGLCDYCNNPEYNWVSTDGFWVLQPGDNDCDLHTFDQSLVKGEEHFSIITSEQILRYWQYDCAKPNTKPAQCVEDVIEAPPQKCVCGSNTTRLVAAPEEMKITFTHSYVHTEGTKLPDYTYVRVADSNQNLAEFDHRGKSKAAVTLTLEDVLTWTGVSLDERWDAKDPTTPHYRLAGLKVTFNVRYYNWDLQPGGERTLSSRNAPTVAVLELHAIRSQWSSVGPSIHYGHQSAALSDMGLGVSDDVFDHVDVYRYGVVLTFQGGGNMGTPNLGQLVAAITQGVLMLGFCTTFVTYYATHFQGWVQKLIALVYWPAATWSMADKAKMYREFLFERLYPRRRQARFAVNAMTAALVFHQMDNDKNNTLTRNELEAHLRRNLSDVGDGRTMTTEELRGVLNLIMESAYADPNLEEEDIVIHRDTTGTVTTDLTLPRWINLATPDEVSLESIMRLVRKHHLIRSYSKSTAQAAIARAEDELAANRRSQPQRAGHAPSAGAAGQRMQMAPQIVVPGQPPHAVIPGNPPPTVVVQGVHYR